MASKGASRPAQIFDAAATLVLDGVQRSTSLQRQEGEDSRPPGKPSFNKGSNLANATTPRLLGGLWTPARLRGGRTTTKRRDVVATYDGEEAPLVPSFSKSRDNLCIT